MLTISLYFNRAWIYDQNTKILNIALQPEATGAENKIKPFHDQWVHWGRRKKEKPLNFSLPCAKAVLVLVYFLHNLFRKCFAWVPINSSGKQELLAQQKNLLVPDKRTASTCTFQALTSVFLKHKAAWKITNPSPAICQVALSNCWYPFLLLCHTRHNTNTLLASA